MLCNLKSVCSLLDFVSEKQHRFIAFAFSLLRLESFFVSSSFDPFSFVTLFANMFHLKLLDRVTFVTSTRSLYFLMSKLCILSMLFSEAVYM